MGINKVNTIQFNEVTKSFQEWTGDNSFDEIPFNTIEVIVDGENLINHLKRYESPLAEKTGHPEIAGLYVGGDPSNLLKSIDEFDDYSSESLVYLFQCDECMSSKCPFHLAFKISKEGNNIYWTDFQQQKSTYPFIGPPYTNKKSDHQKLLEVKGNWDYKGFGPFVFAEEDYSNALKELRRAVSEAK
jgi:hypothetical protein